MAMRLAAVTDWHLAPAGKMPRPVPRRWLALVAALAVLACEPPRSVESWVTTGDRSRLLEPQPLIPLERTLNDSPRGDSVSPSATIIRVDASQRFQSIHGFGAALTDASTWLLQHRLSATQRDSLLRELFSRDANALGLSAVRITLGASDFSRTHYSYDDLPAAATSPIPEPSTASSARDDSLRHFSIAPARDALLPLLRAARRLNPALVIMGTPWSAPAWMKSSGSLIGGTLREDAYDAYARYLVRTVDAFAEVGVPLQYLSVQNEPHHEPPDYPGMRLDPAQRARLIGRHLGPLLASRDTASRNSARRGDRPRLLEWDHNWDASDAPLAVLADSAARRYVSGVAWHCYAGDVAAQSTVRASHPEMETWFTECAGGEWAPNFGDNLRWNVATLVIGATRHWARGVMLWNLALDQGHGPHVGGCNNCRGVVTIDSATGGVSRNEEYYALAHASRFVRPGAVRVWSTTDVNGVATVAFRHDDEGTLVLIAVNLADRARSPHVQGGERGFVVTLPAGAAATCRWKDAGR